MRMGRRAFEELVEAALDALPADFAEKLQDVDVIVEQEPGPEERDAAGGRSELLGIYRGVPLTESSVWDSRLAPNQIVIFQGPIQRIARTRREIVELVRTTVLHEVAHHFGISDQRLRELGY
jgi:predicted Zn-dependent protease with MMP-like domain